MQIVLGETFLVSMDKLGIRKLTQFDGGIIGTLLIYTVVLQKAQNWQNYGVVKFVSIRSFQFRKT
ncbi:hypothetical protein BpHYR1_024460 [Brachionus plicatilis]|uniref:Uncharacterized protein n=1 Tax=Brachionus plicatilis TaxID=10195 RepID=A0A3M7PY19_BRAPC|nr:hypothetical protein BpHYR1_024460 [Brachionus plicatilis]